MHIQRERWAYVIDRHEFGCDQLPARLHYRFCAKVNTINACNVIRWWSPEIYSPNSCIAMYSQLKLKCKQHTHRNNVCFVRLNFSSLQLDVFHFSCAFFLCSQAHALRNCLFDFSPTYHTASEHSISTIPFNLLLHRSAVRTVFLVRSFILSIVFTVLQFCIVTSLHVYSVFVVGPLKLPFFLARFKFQ